MKKPNSKFRWSRLFLLIWMFSSALAIRSASVTHNCRSACYCNRRFNGSMKSNTALTPPDTPNSQYLDCHRFVVPAFESKSRKQSVGAFQPDLPLAAATTRVRHCASGGTADTCATTAVVKSACCRSPSATAHCTSAAHTAATTAASEPFAVVSNSWAVAARRASVHFLGSSIIHNWCTMRRADTYTTSS